MARFRQAQTSKRPIVSNKEIVDSVVFIVAAGVTTDIDLATAVNDYVGAVGTCPLGASILGFYLETSTNNVDNIVGRTDWLLVKRDSGLATTNFSVPGASGGNVRRKSIFHESKGIGQGSATTAGGQSTRMREFIKIPRKFRRMGENDAWTIRVGSSENYSFCLKCIYKWYL